MVRIQPKDGFAIVRIDFPTAHRFKVGFDSIGQLVDDLRTEYPNQIIQIEVESEDNKRT